MFCVAQWLEQLNHLKPVNACRPATMLNRMLNLLEHQLMQQQVSTAQVQTMEMHAWAFVCERRTGNDATSRST